MGWAENQQEIEESLNSTADQDLGTVVAVLDGQGRFDEASALELASLSYSVRLVDTFHDTLTQVGGHPR